MILDGLKYEKQLSLSAFHCLMTQWPYHLFTGAIIDQENG